VSVEAMRCSSHPEMQRFIEVAEETGRGYGAWRVDGDEVIHLHSGDGPSEIVILRSGEVHRRPIDPALFPKTAHRLWRATHVVR
jgi:hypothetical protein